MPADTTAGPAGPAGPAATAATAGPATQGPAATAAPSVIHDLGYRRYDGPRLGRAHIARALAWHSFRSAFGLGRGAKAKVVPIIAMVALCLPAAINAFTMSRGNSRLVSYDAYQPALRVIVMTIFVAVQAPELVSRDLRSRVLPLYFSRPIKTADYPLAKYLAFTGACLVMMEVPVLLLYIGTIVNSHGGAAVWTQTRELIPGLLVGLLWSVVLAAIGLFLASLTGRRALATGAVAIFLLLTYTLSQILLQVERHNVVQAGRRLLIPPPDLAEKVSGLFSPFTLIDGTRVWLGSPTTADNVRNVGAFGAVYAVVLVVLVALCLEGLNARYRKARLS